MWAWSGDLHGLLAPGDQAGERLCMSPDKGQFGSGPKVVVGFSGFAPRGAPLYRLFTGRYTNPCKGSYTISYTDLCGLALIRLLLEVLKDAFWACSGGRAVAPHLGSLAFSYWVWTVSSNSYVSGVTRRRSSSSGCGIRI